MGQLIKTLECNEQQQWFNMVTTKWQIDSYSIRMEVGKQTNKQKTHFKLKKSRLVYSRKRRTKIQNAQNED